MELLWSLTCMIVLLVCVPNQAAPDCSSIDTDLWIKGVGNYARYNYFITGKQHNLRTCELLCQNLEDSSTLARISTSMLTVQFREMLCLNKTSFWIKVLRSNRTCTTMTWPHIQQEVNCSSATYQCLCQRSSIHHTTPTAPSLIDFTQTIKNDFYATVYRKLNYEGATVYCRTNFNCSLMSYMSPITYMEVTESLSIARGSYWIQHTDERSNSCLVVKKEDNVGIVRSSCDVKHYVICNDVIDDTLAIRNDGFVSMIFNMTVSQKQTQRWINKLECADDHRKSAQTVGRVGLAILVSVALFCVCMDLHRVFKFIL